MTGALSCVGKANFIRQTIAETMRSLGEDAVIRSAFSNLWSDET
ncbi:hypothetical protein PARPLA_00924 [Rhodobacteraceae bacterium THAF1]|nr:hypothetical protein [Palleronia sp. THAF1]QFU09550.1 hypothetical protein FIU81_12795 [Palleronia sp. THAF1]VDC20085.1 hypothetical protein PARPLA_00924 [Rhodobacteraceae bacterium THAF1]